MSDEPAQQITDFEDMDCRHVGGNAFRVLNRREGTVSKVNVDSLTCNCEDMEYNERQERDVCKHVEFALFQAPKVRRSVPEELVADISSLIVSLNDSAELARDAAEQYDKALLDQRDVEAGQDAQAAQQTDSPDPIECFESMLSATGLDVDKFEYWIDEDYGSLQCRKDGYLDDGEFEKWSQFTSDIGMSWDGQNEVNFLKEDEFSEVLW